MHGKQLINIWLVDSWSRWFLVFVLLLNAFGWAAVWWLVPHTIDVSPLHYTIYFGINLTGRWQSLFWLPGIGAAAIVSHSIFARLVDHPLWRRLWLVLAVVVNMMMIMALTAMVLLLKTANI